MRGRSPVARQDATLIAAGSEKASWAWAEGAERVCRICGEAIAKLDDLGEVRTLYGGEGHGRRELTCMDCHMGRRKGDLHSDA
jgi:hypothetical protein